MKTIWKSELLPVDVQKLSVPAGAVFLTIQTQNDIPCVWYECETDNDLEDYEIFIFGTGHMALTNDLTYLGTFQMPRAGLVFHVYVR